MKLTVDLPFDVDQGIIDAVVEAAAGYPVWADNQALPLGPKPNGAFRGRISAFKQSLERIDSLIAKVS